MRKRRGVLPSTPRIALAVGFVAALSAAAASAGVIVDCQNIQGGVSGSGALLGCTQAQGNSLTNQNILFNQNLINQTFTTVAPNNFVQGITNTPQNLPAIKFDFASTSDLLLVNNGGGGFATITSNSDSNINNLKYFVDPGQSRNAFSVLDTNVDVAKDTSGSIVWTIHAVTSGGIAETFTTVSFGLTSGANNFTFVAENSEVITDVSFLATDGVIAALVDDVKQTSVNLTNVPDVSVSEPGTLAVLGVSLLGLGFSTSRRRRNPRGRDCAA